MPLLASQPANGQLQHAFNACALSLLGNRISSGSPQFAVQAYSEYSKALTATQFALKDPQASISDATLATVLLLGIFEVRFLFFFSLSFLPPLSLSREVALMRTPLTNL